MALPPSWFREVGPAAEEHGRKRLRRFRNVLIIVYAALVVLPFLAVRSGLPLTHSLLDFQIVPIFLFVVPLVLVVWYLLTVAVADVLFRWRFRVRVICVVAPILGPLLGRAVVWVVVSVREWF